ncbi:recombinase family protein [uncultured Dokdonia sp.]|uniref:recombinase family protein n=1 Tax=uncultured Dokdonia sp. TaxID=575653 RepID=UPI00260E1798|nr:recombinase family protein [uncultured Dokdonia sp.]
MNTHIIHNFIYGGYVRKSSESEDRQVQSIERQKDDLLSVIEKEGLILHDSIFEETKSAFSIGRQEFNQLIKQTEKGAVNAWLCWHPNRLSRNPMDAGMIIYLLDIGKLHHIKTPSRVYYNTPTDKMMLQFEFMMSKKDSDDKSSFVKSGLNKRYQKGFPCGKAPIGYLNNKSEERGNRGWLVDKQRFEKLHLLFNRFLEGNDSLSSITEYARNTLKLTTPLSKRQGGKFLGQSMIEHVLKNPIYAGFFYSKNEKDNGTTLRILHKDVPRIIKEEDHSKIRVILGKRNHPNVQKHFTPYTGHIIGEDGNTIGADVKFQLICDCNKKFAYRAKETCPECGIAISKMKHPKYLSYTYYFNIKRRKTKGYSAKGIEEKKIDAFLIDFYDTDLKMSPEEFAWTKKHLKELRDRELETDKRLLKIHQKGIASLETKREKLRRLFVEGMISMDEFKKDIATLEEELNLKQKGKKYAEDWYNEMDGLLDNLQSLGQIIKKADYNSKKELLKSLGSNLVWNEEKLFIIKPDWLEHFIKGRKMLHKKYKSFEPKNNVINKGLNSVLDVRCPTVLCWLGKIRTYYYK